MERLAASGSPPVYHGQESSGDAIGSGVRSLITQEDLRESFGELPRLFALLQEFGGEGDDVIEVVTYGISLSAGATTIGVDGRLVGRWRSAESAARRLGAHLVWLG